MVVLGRGIIRAVIGVVLALELSVKFEDYDFKELIWKNIY